MPRSLLVASALATALALGCSAAPDADDLFANGGTDAGTADAPPAVAPADTEHDAPGHQHPVLDAAAPDAAPPAYVPANCDEDNPITDDAPGIDKPLPSVILQFARQRDWGCMHREWHDARNWDTISAPGSSGAWRYQYATKKGWTRAAVQEGAPGNGLEFLAMHRVMLATLRSTFPADAKLFAGWTTPPTTATADDPLPATASGTAAFSANFQRAITRLTTQIASFESDDAFGIYVQSQLRWTASNPAARSTDLTSGIHAYFHVRFDDPKSTMRMQRFNRNLESQVFWKLHGWLDGLWTKSRAARGLKDATDTPYLTAMGHACHHMGMSAWDGAKSVCKP